MLGAWSLVELFWYRPLTALWRIWATVLVIAGRRPGWGSIPRGAAFRDEPDAELVPAPLPRFRDEDLASQRRPVCQPSRVGREVEDATRPCPMCGATTWILLDGMSTLQALEGGLQALAFSCDRCGFIRWHRKDKVDATKPPEERLPHVFRPFRVSITETKSPRFRRLFEWAVLGSNQ